MKKKQRWSLLLFGMLFLWTGCGIKTGKEVKLDAENPVFIEIWHYYNGAQKIAFDKLVTEFNETVGLKEGIIAEAFSQGSVTELMQKVLDSANKKVGAAEIPEIFAAYADTAYEIDRLGLIAPLDQYLTEKEIQEYVPAYIEEGRFDKEHHLKIFPIAKSTEIFLLNKTDWEIFAQAEKVSYAELQTIEGITRVAEKYYNWTDRLTPDILNDGKAFFGRDAMANYMIIGCKQLGVTLFSAENGEVTFQLDETVLRKLWDNFYVPYIKGYFLANSHFRSDDAKTGDIIALIGSSSGAAYFPEKVARSDVESYPIEVIALPFPYFEGGEKYAVQQGAGMVVKKAGKKKEYASTIFLKWFTESERNMNFSLDSGYLPVKKEGNRLDLLEKNLAEQKETIPNNLRISLPYVMETAISYQLYTNRVFHGGTEAREVLERSMLSQAKTDRASILQKINEGVSADKAIAEKNTENTFQQWLTTFENELESSLKNAK